MEIKLKIKQTFPIRGSDIHIITVKLETVK